MDERVKDFINLAIDGAKLLIIYDIRGLGLISVLQELLKEEIKESDWHSITFLSKGSIRLFVDYEYNELQEKYDVALLLGKPCFQMLYAIENAVELGSIFVI